MKRVWTSGASVALAGVLVAGAGMITGAASAEPAGLASGLPGVSDSMQLADARLKGKPPYKRSAAEKGEMEKGQFARFEEKPDEAEDGKKTPLRGVPGKHPPFNRN